MNQPYKYKAFISYSHKDKKFAKWLHKRIENYKIPKSLREKYPSLPKDLKRSIFRDVKELPVAASLPENLTDALKNSEFLIVICSPNAVSSNWVGKEIEEFKSYHGEGKVLPFIKEGEAHAKDPAQEAFPQALLYKVNATGSLTNEKTEPLAGNAQKFWNKKHESLKLIAAILKVDFSDLEVRDNKEERKQLLIQGTFITSLFIIAGIGYWENEQANNILLLFLVGTAGLAYWKYKENHSIKGYGIDYMEILQTVNEKRALLLTNIPDEQKDYLNEKIKKLEKKLADIKQASEAISKIEGAFAKEALRILNIKGAKKALDFINSPESRKDEEKLLEKVASKHLVRANIYISNQKYDKAILSYEELIKYDFSYKNILEYGNFLYKQNNLERAENLYNKLLNTKLSTIEKATTLNNLALLYEKVNRIQEAEKAYLEVLTLDRILAKNNPLIYNSNVATTLNNLAMLYDKINRIKDAEKAYLESLNLYRNLTKSNPSTHNFNLTITLNNLAMLYDKINRIKEAKIAYLEALHLYRNLAKSNPSSYNFYISTTLNNLAISYDKTNRLQEAEVNYVEALDLYRDLAKSNPSAYNSYVSTTLNNLANLYDKTNQTQESERAYLEALSIYRLLVKNNPSLYNYNLSMTLNNLANLYYKTKQMKEAKKAYLKALGLVYVLAKSNPSVYNYYLSSTLNNLTVFYYSINQFKEGEEAGIEALKLRQFLAKNNPLAYNSDVATTLNNLALLYTEVNRIKEAEKAYLEALSLYQVLAKSNPSAYNSDVATIFNNLAILYIKTNRLKEAEILRHEILKLEEQSKITH